MSPGIGEKLRLAREAQGIALRDISEQTRISIRYLEAIEVDDYRRLPGGIFNRSFIRAYAKFIGFDEKEAIEEYTRTLIERGDANEDGSTKTFRSLVYTEDNAHTRSPLITFVLAVVILAILSLAVWAGLRFYQRAMQRKARPPVSSSHLVNQSTTYSVRVILSSESAYQIIKEGEHDFTL